MTTTGGSGNKRPYREFGELVAKQRAEVLGCDQAGLAKLLRTTQQTVSRWELGQSRPRLQQLGAIAKVLRIPTDQLAAVAGHSAARPQPSVAGLSYDAPFPFASLAAESFERFIVDLLYRMNAGARVWRLGGQGDDQEGVDVVADLKDGSRIALQCKRVAEFGPQKVHDAVAAVGFVAKRYVLVLSRAATADARRAILNYPDWEIWDQEDLSNRVRALSLAEQKILVRRYFRVAIRSFLDSLMMRCGRLTRISSAIARSAHVVQSCLAFGWARCAACRSHGCDSGPTSWNCSAQGAWWVRKIPPDCRNLWPIIQGRT